MELEGDFVYNLNRNPGGEHVRLEFAAAPD